MCGKVGGDQLPKGWQGMGPGGGFAMEESPHPVNKQHPHLLQVSLRELGCTSQAPAPPQEESGVTGGLYHDTGRSYCIRH